VKPIVQALLIADHVYTDTTTGKKVVAGIFHRIKIQKMTPQMETPPAGHVEGQPGQQRARIAVPPAGMQSGSPFCYISLTEVRGRCPMELRYVDLDEDKVLFGTQFEIDFKDPLETVELVFPLPMLPGNKPGVYVLELLCNNEPLGYHRIRIEEEKPAAPTE
jgi:hypothetical protein